MSKSLAIFVASLENYRGYILRWHVLFAKRITFYNFFNEYFPRWEQWGYVYVTSPSLSSLRAENWEPRAEEEPRGRIEYVRQK